VSPSHASALRKEGGEALTGGVQAGLLSSEINRLRVADLVTRWERPHEASRKDGSSTFRVDLEFNGLPSTRNGEK